MLQSRPLPLAASIQEKLPLNPELKEMIQKGRHLLQQPQASIKPLILGPCSIHDPETDFFLAEKIGSLQKEHPEFLFVFRCHLEKPRSNHYWRGFLMDPDLDGRCDFEKGILLSRKFMIALVEQGIPLSYEFIDPFLAPYVEDLVTIGIIGARTVYSQTHRQLAAALPMPVIFKNSLDGRLDGVLDAMELTQNGFFAPKMGPNGAEMVYAKNPFTHMMLRGGFHGPNHDQAEQGKNRIENRGLKGSVFVDCAHQNSFKDPLLQKKLLEQILSNDSPFIDGIMIECHLEEGNQPFSKKPKRGLSITDPCLSLMQVEQSLKLSRAALRHA
jgi:3-deoxy-7-phosphoheptulonate synthase